MQADKMVVNLQLDRKTQTPPPALGYEAAVPGPASRRRHQSMEGAGRSPARTAGRDAVHPPHPSSKETDSEDFTAPGNFLISDKASSLT